MCVHKCIIYYVSVYVYRVFNKIYVFKNSKSQSKYSYICEIKSLPNKKVLTPKNIQVKITSKESIHGRNIKV